MQPTSSSESTPSASSIVARALAREGIDPANMGVFGGGYLNLIKGRPHITVGFRTLLENPVALLIALWQAAFIYAFVHDAIQLFSPDKNTIWLHHIPRITGLWGWDAIAFLFLAVAVPFSILNFGWGVMAAAITGRLRPAILLTGLTGMVPLRIIADWLMPRWWFFQVEWRLDMAIAARILQFSWAYKLATGRSRAEIEMDWARALDRHTKPLLDGLLSYTIQPILVLIALLIGIVAVDFFFHAKILSGVLGLSRLPFGDSESFTKPYFSYLALIGAWFAFERACLGAMVFHYLSESDAQHPSRARGDGLVVNLGMLALVCMLAIPLAAAWQWSNKVNNEVHPPASGATWIDPALNAAGHEYYGAMGLIAPSSETGYFFFVLENEQGKPVIKLFLRPGDSLYFPVPAGRYTTKAYHGTAWKGDEYIFGTETKKVVDTGVVVCPHYRLERLNINAVAGPITRLCAEHMPPYMDVDDFDRLQTRTILLCGPQAEATPLSSPYEFVGTEFASMYLSGASPKEITCSMPIRSMKSLSPFGPVLDALSRHNVN